LEIGTMADPIIQRTVFPREPRLQSLYYRIVRASQSGRELEFPDRFSARIPGGTCLATDTYFNSFFESYWRCYARVSRLSLGLTVSGIGSVRLVRRSAVAGSSVLASANFGPREARVELEVPEPAVHFREAGLLHFELTARSAEVRILGATWAALDAQCVPVRLVAGYCTFNREKLLAGNIETLLGDPGVAALLERVVVVDQGTRKLKQHTAFAALPPAVQANVQVLEQGNYGGAGGFTRSILEAVALPRATHMLLMDDDAVLEPESVFRAAAFLGLARSEIAVGAPMLDMLRPLEIHEAGGRMQGPRLGTETLLNRYPVATQDALLTFQEIARTDYNAWWFFAFPLRAVERVGLPLPLFVRGDDAEFGCRLLKSGIPTVTMPGLGVWHEPFYLKTGSWHPYYDLRNMLILTALHYPQSRRRVVQTFLGRLLNRILLLDYFGATLLCEAVDDYCRGPEVLADDPQKVHKKLLALQKELVAAELPRDRPLPTATAATPRTPVGWAIRLLRCLGRQLLHSGPKEDAPPRTAIKMADARWWTLGLADAVALDDWHASSYAVRRRSRQHFTRLLARGIGCGARLGYDFSAVAESWRAAQPHLTSLAFWQDYLDIQHPTCLPASTEDRRAASYPTFPPASTEGRRAA
jgi:galactofuranosylgalactofuranosylrhamnosyl-N-acetylglucosaminyl-diphospho-decaprenol beta-1,5/1,6-galactofuranosyltransferase